MNNEILISLAGIGVLGIACQWLAWWAKLPAILFLLLSGLIVGPVTGILKPDDLFGDLLFPMVSLSVAIILFEGSLTLRIDEIRGSGSVVRNLISIGALITWLITSAATYFMLAFPFDISLLFGAVVVVTGPTVIMPMLRTVRPNAKIANILRWD
jgi:NhaP-type Na+/H+ or K+/H+ antiporter